MAVQLELFEDARTAADRALQSPKYARCPYGPLRQREREDWYRTRAMMARRRQGKGV